MKLFFYKTYLVLILLLCFFAIQTSVSQIKTDNQNPTVFIQNITPEKIEDNIEKILKNLTLEEKVAMCHAQSKFSTKGVPRLGIPEIWMSDGPHGVRAEISWDSWDYAGWTNDSITAFPALTCLAASFNPELSSQYGFSLGEEARYRKKDVLLGPGVNIYRTPMNGRNFEYMGEDPFLASTMVVPYIKGIQKNGVAACVKHFVLNNQEHWRDIINVEISDRALYEIYLPAFKAAVKEAGVWSLMGSYNKVRGQYACHNEMLNKILKTDWGFDGVVISDWSGAHTTRESALYGLDLEMGTGTDGLGTTTENHYQYYYLANPFLEALKKSEISESVVDDKVRRILRLMYRTNMNPNRPFGRMNNREHHDVARKIGVEGIVLLKNENNFFPIKDEKNITIAIIGENATRSMTAGGGSSELKPKFEVSPLEGLKQRYKNATLIHTMGYESGPSAYDKVISGKLNADSLKVKAVEFAKKADIVLFVGGLTKSHHQDSEGDDRLQYELPFGQVELLSEIQKVNKNIGMLLVTGNAVDMSWSGKVKGILQTWYLGSIAGHAIADVVSGDVNPSGKLPFSFPKKLEDNAAHSFGKLSYPGDGVNQYYKEDIFVGYRWHDTKKIAAQYAFGYGLSYTNFSLSNIKTDKNYYSENDLITISCDVNNTGSIDGAEVVQVYVGKPKSKVKRALKELKGFKKVHVNKEQSSSVSIKIPVSSLTFYDETISDWNLEKGEYIVYVGNTSNNISKKINITID
ncbi:beta-glucosidase [Tenacibaculum adriaticum]|uniref:Beta-glucosidase n=1 Tax=Tenacibaculum adriaticum TaxID=413713 RepID=A0A5S5DR78_9FLAO|nr:glycoside hydrolase family 3 C-terminal domain-containing protein [Tenacibaculum adriaticum]TYP98184.1 beta-glucosidase [Tenacibaculum adriaticum]